MFSGTRIQLALALLCGGCAHAFNPSPQFRTSKARVLRATPTMPMGPKEDSRRDWFSSVAVTIGAASIGFSPSSVHAAAPVDFGAVRADIAKLVAADPDKGPTLVRLAWHSSGTYDKIQKDGGSFGGTIRFKEELVHGANAGLNKAVTWLEPIHKKSKGLSYADLYTLAGVVAIKEMKGPEIGWRAGRVDALKADAVTPDGRLPAADKGSPEATATGLRQVFNRMGFDDKEIVALSGAHALGRCHPDASGYTGPWTPTPTTFNNAYYLLLTNLKWTPKQWDGPFQYEDPSGKLMMLPSDLLLTSDAGFKPYTEMYAKNEGAFFKDFAAAFQKLEELGCNGLHEV